MKIDPIETERLILREFESSDFAAVHSYAIDPEVVEFMEWGPNTEAETRAFIQGQLDHQKEPNRTIFEHAVTLKSSGELIGGVGITVEEDTGIIGYCFGQKSWSQGYATEAAQGLMKWSGLKHFRATCDVENARSRHVLEKLGLRVVKRIDSDKEIRGRWRDTYVLETPRNS